MFRCFLYTHLHVYMNTYFFKKIYINNFVLFFFVILIGNCYFVNRKVCRDKAYYYSGIVYDKTNRPQYFSFLFLKNGSSLPIYTL